jgi:polyferredoxin
LARWLAYLHPTWMLVSIGLAALALRAGLVLRRSRRGSQARTPRMRPAHLRLAKPAVVLLLLGFVGGPISSVWLRGWEPFHTFHGIVGLVVVGCFAAAAGLGHRIERGRSRAFDAHALLGGLGVLLAALAAVAGFVLLP